MRNTAFVYVILAVLAAILLVISLNLLEYLPDDSFITFRYARNVLGGAGFVFNEGERVEGYTNFLWVVILALAGKIGLPMILSARVIGFMATAAALVLSGFIARELIPERLRGGGGGAAAVMLAPIVLAVMPPVATWCLSGTEMPLFTALLAVGTLLLIRGSRPAAVLAVFAVLGLVRPEGLVFFAVAIAALLAIGKRRFETAGVGAALFAAIYIPYGIWKTHYFGALLPNTFYAKTGPPSIMLSNGGRYLASFLVSHGYLAVAGLLLARRGEGAAKPLAIPAAFIAVHWLEVLFLGGDWMPHFRLLLPTLPLAAALAAAGAATIRPSRALAATIALLAFLAVLPGYPRGPLLSEREVVRAYAGVGQRLGEILPPQTSLGLGSTGAIGYYSGLRIIDILGLTEPAIARYGEIVARQPGHLKTDGAYVFEKRPDLLLLGNIQIHREPMAEEEFRRRLKVQEKPIVSQPSFSALYEYAEIPIGHGFLLSCFKLKSYFLPLGQAPATDGASAR